MGKLNECSARRPGRRERARVKNKRTMVCYYVPGAGHVCEKLGRKKLARRMVALAAHLSGNRVVSAGSGSSEI